MSFYRVRVTFSGPAGTPWLSTWNFDIGGGTPQQAATAVSTFWGVIDNGLSTSVTWNLDTDVEMVNEATGQVQSVIPVTTATGTGGQSDAMLPRQTQGLLRLRTGAFHSGREVQGRIFIPGYTEVNNDTGGVPLAGVVSGLNAAAATLIADANSIWVVWSPTRGLFEPVSSASAWTQWATLRGRRD